MDYTINIARLVVKYYKATSKTIITFSRMKKSIETQAVIASYHNHDPLPNQCSSILVQTINAPISFVWFIIRDFNNPQAYKQFIKKCTLRKGSGGIGSIREVMVISGLPAGTSVERLEYLDDDMHIMSFSIIGGDHRLVNYRSTISVHEEEEEEEKGIVKTVAVESYVVDVPHGNSKEDTCSFADTIV